MLNADGNQNEEDRAPEVHGQMSEDGDRLNKVPAPIEASRRATATDAASAAACLASSLLFGRGGEGAPRKPMHLPDPRSLSEGHARWKHQQPGLVE
jgi:hypothetical protein